MKIDWNKAPQGATHYNPEIGRWFKREDGRWWSRDSYEKGWGVHWHHLATEIEERLIARPPQASIGDRVLSRIHSYRDTHGREPTHVYLGKKDMAEASVSTGGFPKSILTEYMGLEVVPVNLPSHLNLACVPKVDGRRRPVRIDVDRLEAEIESYALDDLVDISTVKRLIQEEWQMCVDQPIEDKS